MGDSYRPGSRDYGPSSSRPSYHENRDSRDYYTNHNNYYDRPPPPMYEHDRPPPPFPPVNDRGFHFRGAADSAPRNDMYQFRGRDDRRYDDYPGRDYRDEHYPPREPSHGFDFRPQNASHAPRFPDSRPNDRERRPRREGRDNRARGNGKGNRGRFVKPGASERAILNTHRSPTPEQLEGMNVGGSRFNFDNVISLNEKDDDDDGSASMDTSDSEDDDRNANGSSVAHAIAIDSDEEDEHPRAKRARIGSPKATAARTPAPTASVDPPRPKWSNPDPYTVLPPPGESSNKPKKDVVQLIRQAKVENQAEAKSNEASTDFISLSFDDEGRDNADGGEEGEVLSDTDDVKDLAPLQRPKTTFSHLDNLHPQRSVSGSSAPSDNVPKPGTAQSYRHTSNGLPPMPDMTSNAWPPPPPPPVDDALPPPPAEPALEYDTQQDYQKAIERQENTSLANKPKNKKRKFDQVRDTGDIIEIWQAKSPEASTPWHTAGHTTEDWDNADVWLHNEIMDFYDFVKPRLFEGEVRADLIRRIQHAVDQGMAHVNIEAFGSYASELYLPTADMDLVAMSDAFLSYGNVTIGRNYKQMRRFADCLQNNNLIKYGSLTIISKAKVPILKFTESVTALRVDISFENDSGTVALSTFARWREMYPAMPFIVALIKQYLAMRDLSEVVNGGLGGFTIICLVVYTIHTLELSKGVGYARKNLDKTLLAFFKHWGMVHNIRTEGLDMKAMRTVPKSYFNGRQSKPDRLLIIDPNNNQNNISGGSSGAERIFAKFAKAYHEIIRIQEDCEARKFEMGIPGHRSSLLGLLWGGDYESFALQRRRLEDLHRRGYSPASVGDVEIIDAPTQCTVQQAPPRPVPQSSAPQQDKAEVERLRKQAKNQRRKERKQKAREQNDAGENNNSGNNSGAIGSGATSNGDRHEPPPSISDNPIPTAPPTRMQTRSQRKSQPQAQQPAPPAQQPPPLAKPAKPTKTAKDKAAEKKDRALVSRARDFKRMFPGAQVNPGKLTKKEFKQLKTQHTNTG
ncbi:hypothetical protein MBLNU457_6187t1 [Dothideomycetes sp. NU457]